MSNDSGLNSQERGHSELYKLVDRATRVEPDSAVTSTLNDSDSNSQEQGRLELYKPMDRATHVVPEPANAATSVLNDSGLNEQERSELYRLVDGAPSYATNCIIANVCSKGCRLHEQCRRQRNDSPVLK